MDGDETNNSDPVAATADVPVRPSRPRRWGWFVIALTLLVASIGMGRGSLALAQEELTTEIFGLSWPEASDFYLIKDHPNLIDPEGDYGPGGTAVILPSGLASADELAPMLAPTPWQEYYIPERYHYWKNENYIHVRDTYWTPLEAYLDTWKGSAEFGLNGSEGNAQTFNIRTGAKGKRETDKEIQTFSIWYTEKSARGNLVALTTVGEGKQQWKIAKSRWSYYVRGMFEYDEFRPFDVRISGDTGFEYQIRKDKRSTWTANFGASTSREIGGTDNTWKPELSLGTTFSRKLTSLQEVSFESNYFPNVTDFGDFRLNSKASWKIIVDPDWGLSLKLSATDRYASSSSQVFKNDLDYSLVFLLDF